MLTAMIGGVPGAWWGTRRRLGGKGGRPMRDRVRAVVRHFAEPLTSQLARPHGPTAGLVAPALNLINGPSNRAALAALAARRGERLLEVGFGGAYAMRRALAAVGDGRVTGIDVSPEMVRRARRTFRGEIATGRIEVLEGDVAAPPLPDGAFDGTYTVNTIYFWSDPAAGLGELFRVLRPGGRLVIAMVAGARVAKRRLLQGTPPTPEAVVEQLRRVGFADIELRRERFGVELVVARRP